MRLDGVRLFVVDVSEVSAAYERFLGIPGVQIDDGRQRFQFERGAIEIAPSASDAPRAAVIFVAEPGDDLANFPADPGDHGGLEVLVIADPAVVPAPARPDAIAAIDHVVVRTGDPERAIAHWRDGLGLRLALDRTFAERKLRLVFFRSGGLTLEYAHALEGDEASSADAMHGVSYRVSDLAAVLARLVAAGFDVSEARAGMKPGSQVATVRSGTAEVPTLLIQPAPRA